MAFAVSRSCSCVRRLFSSTPQRLPPNFLRSQHRPKFLKQRKIYAMSTVSNGAYSSVSGTHWNVELMPSTWPEAKLGSGEIGAYDADLLAVGVYADIFETTGEGDEETVTCTSDALMSKDNELNGALSYILSKGEFKGEAGKSFVVRGGGRVKNIGLFGLGKKDESTVTPSWGRSVYYKMGVQIGHATKGCKTATLAIDFDQVPQQPLPDVISQMMQGILVDSYESTRYKEKPKKSKLKEILLMNLEASAQEGIDKGFALAKGTLLTIYSVESPPNVCYPQYMVDCAKMISETYPDTISLKVLEKDECEKLKMGLYLAVANASSTAPKFIHLTYKKGNPKKTLALVGKGVTFDTGGYNVKTSGGRMEDMKFDMGGGGAVIGAAYILGALSPDDTEVHCIVAACENMISGQGYRPSDIITASNGKSVEVMNTDAEGRLTLADALLYAQNECKATSVINIATLTGAIIIALGDRIAGLFTPNDDMAQSITEASHRTGDRLWRMPLDEEYLETLKKGIADLRNVGSRAGSSITAGLFLKEFVKTDEVEWAHLDIAGAAWMPDKSAPTGYGAALLAEWSIATAKKAT